MDGFGPVIPDGTNFHADWERRMFGAGARVTRSAGVGAGMFRAAIESMPPDEYLAASYYERWMYGVERRLERGGTLTCEDVESAHARASRRRRCPSERSRARRALPRGAAQGSADAGRRRCALPAGPARARAPHAAGGAHALPALRARRDRRDRARARRRPAARRGRARGGAPSEALYAVRFRSDDSSAPGEEPGFRVLVDLSESYLEEAG